MYKPVKVIQLKKPAKACKTYEYENRNPKKRQGDDCVFRAIAGATSRPWEEVFASLCQLGLTTHAMPNYPIVFRKYIKAIGGEYVYKAPVVNGQFKKDGNMTVRRFAKEHPKGNFIVRVWWHVTCVRNGTIYDTWDCGQEAVTEAWQVTPGAKLFEDYKKEVAWLED